MTNKKQNSILRLFILILLIVVPLSLSAQKKKKGLGFFKKKKKQEQVDDVEETENEESTEEEVASDSTATIPPTKKKGLQEILAELRLNAELVTEEIWNQKLENRLKAMGYPVAGADSSYWEQEPYDSQFGQRIKLSSTTNQYWQPIEEATTSEGESVKDQISQVEGEAPDVRLKSSAARAKQLSKKRRKDFRKLGKLGRRFSKGKFPKAPKEEREKKGKGGKKKSSGGDVTTSSPEEKKEKKDDN